MFNLLFRHKLRIYISFINKNLVIKTSEIPIRNYKFRHKNNCTREHDSKLLIATLEEATSSAHENYNRKHPILL